MERPIQFPLLWINKKTLLAVIAVGLLAIIIITSVRFNITGNYEGIFLLRGKKGALFELKDDLYLGEGNRYIAGFDFENEKRFFLRIVQRQDD